MRWFGVLTVNSFDDFPNRHFSIFYCSCTKQVCVVFCKFKMDTFKILLLFLKFFLLLLQFYIYLSWLQMSKTDTISGTVPSGKHSSVPAD